VGLHQGSALSLYLFDVIIDVLTKDVRREASWCMLFVDDVVLCGKKKEDMEEWLNEWRTSLEERELKINQTKTVQMNFGKEEESINLDGNHLTLFQNSNIWDLR
jgi:Reverse transcriptase (RNA-dependent DNA polymerase).